MKRHAYQNWIAWISSIALFLCGFATAQESIFTYAGEGWTLTVTSLNEDSGEVFGEIAFSTQRAPYRGAISESSGQERARCVYQFENQTYSFEVEIHPDESLTLHINGGAHRLKPQASTPSASDREMNLPPRPETSKYSGNQGSMNQIPGSTPAGNNSSQVQAPSNAQGLPDQIALKQVSFPDITMGGVPAYTMLIPQDWQAKGHIEWSTSEPMLPHSRITATGPDHMKITFMPSMTNMFSEAKPVPGFPKLPTSGVPAPTRIGEWLVDFLRNNTPHKDVRLISDVRDANAERLNQEIAKQLGAQTQNIESTCHIVTYQFSVNGVTVQEETHLTYSKLAPYEDNSIYTQTWMLYFSNCIAARADRFDALKPSLVLYSGTYKSTPKWWNQMIQLRNKLFNMHANQVAAAIAERGRYYDQISTEQYQAWKQQNSSSGGSHKKFIQSIYEVQDYQDSNGNAVELPIHYKHAYSDGQGNYLLSNRFLQPSGNYQEIHPAR